MGNKRGFGNRVDWVTISYPRVTSGIVIFIGALIVFGGIYLYQPIKDKISILIQPPSQEAQLGLKEKRYARVVEITGDVKVKKINRVNWVPARQVDYLQEGDLLQTESGSSARIVFFDGSSYTVNPDSLVAIQKSYEDSANNVRKVAVEVTSGTVDLSTSQKNVEGSTFEVQTANALASFESFSEAKAKYDGKIKESEFSLYKGEAEVTSRGNGQARVRLNALERVRVDSANKFQEKSRLPEPPRLLEPRNPGLFITSEPKSLTVRLKWESVPSARLYRVRVSPSSTFNPLIVNQLVSGQNAYAVRIPDYGAYHWRINAINEKGVESPASDTFSFSVIHRKNDAVKQQLTLKVEKAIPFGQSFEVIGRTDPGVTVFINEEIVDVKGDGSFKHFTRPFKDKGTHELVVVARDLVGLSKTLTETVEVK